MTTEIRVSTEELGNNNFFRPTEIRVGSGPTVRFYPSWDNRFPLPNKLPSWWSPITEIYARITLDELRQIDDDAAAQARFIQRNLTPQSGTLGVPVLKLLLTPTDRITDKDVDYLIHLVHPPNTIMATTPLLYDYYLDDKGVVRVGRACNQDRFIQFAERFATASSSTGLKQVAISLPPSLSHSGVTRLVEAYAKIDTPLAIIDANGSTNKDRYPQLNALIGYGRKRGRCLRQKHGTHFALYGFDLKPFSGRSEVVSALNVLQLNNGLSSFGRRHTVRMMIKRNGALPPVNPRVYFERELSYARSSMGEAMKPIESWFEKEFGRKGTSDEVLKHRRRFENESLIRTAKSMSEWVEAGEFEKQLSRRKVIEKDLRSFKRNNILIQTPPLSTYE